MTPPTPELANALKIGSGVFWTLTYLVIINRGFGDKTYGMPIFALCANIAWEFIFSFLRPHEGVQLYVNITWFVFDLVIVYQCLRFGQAAFRNTMLRGLFYPAFLIILVVSFLGVWTVSAEFNDWVGKYAAFSQNLMMSVLFISMLLSRNSVAGQSLYVAIFKLIGTLFASTLFYLTDPNAPYMNFLYVAILAFDVAYTVLLYLKFREEGINPWNRHRLNEKQAVSPSVA